MTNWIAVASADHVHRARLLGVMQVCHGKKAPLQRVQPQDIIVYYSPTLTFRGKDKFQSFSALGIVEKNEPYQVDIGNGFCPFRRDVRWHETREASIAPLLDHLDFIKNRNSWGYSFRFGLFAINDHDVQLIARAMHAKINYNEGN
jgi:hypothetical protein